MLALVQCTYCRYPQLISDDVYELRLEIQCQECQRFFEPTEDNWRSPDFVGCIVTD